MIDREPGQGPVDPSLDPAIRAKQMEEALFSPQTEEYLRSVLKPRQFAAFGEIRNLLTDDHENQRPILLTGLSGSGKTYIVERVNEALQQSSPDATIQIASCDAMDFTEGDGAMQAAATLQYPFIVTATPLGAEHIKKAGLELPEVIYRGDSQDLPQERNIPIHVKGGFVTWMSSLPDTAPLKEMAARHFDNENPDQLAFQVFDYLEYNFGPNGSAGMHAYVPINLMYAFEDRMQGKQELSGFIDFVNYCIARSDPELHLQKVALSAASRELWSRELANWQAGGLFIRILATDLTGEQEGYLQRQLFPGQSAGFKGHHDFNGILQLFAQAKHHYSLRNRQSNHWARMRLPDKQGGTLEQVDFGHDYDAYRSYFAYGLMDHGPATLRSGGQQAIAVEAILQTAQIPYLGRIIVGPNQLDYSVDDKGNVQQT